MCRGLLIASIATVWLAASLAHAAGAGWRVERVGTARLGYYAVEAALLGNGRGRRVLAWPGRHGLNVSVAQPGRGFGRPRLVKREDSDIRFPRLAMNERGDALILWNYFDGTSPAAPEDRDDGCCYGLRLVVLRRDGHVGPVRTLTPRGRDVYPDGFRIAPGGRFGIVWHEGTYPPSTGRRGLFARLSGPHGLRKPRRIDRDADGVALSFVHGRPRVLMVAHGRRHSRLVERFGDVRGRFGHRRLVARGLARSPSVAAAANERGDEAVAWWRERYRRRPVRAGVRSPGGHLEARTIGHTDQDPYSLPNVAIAPSGAAVVAWTPSASQVRVSIADGPGVVFGPPRFLLRPQGRRRFSIDEKVELAINSRAEAVLAWIAHRPFPRLHAALRTAGGRTVRHTRLAKGYGAMIGGFAAIDKRGRATVAWRGRVKVRAARVIRSR